MPPLILELGSEMLLNRQLPPPGVYYPYDRNYIRNPYGIVGLMTEIPISNRVTMEFGVRHTSSMLTHEDKGDVGAHLTLKITLLR